MSAPETHPWRATLLIIEDDPDQLFLYEQVLAEYRIHSSSNASGATALLEQEIPNVIILDHILADGDLGADLLPAIRAKYAHVPIVMVSGTLDIRKQLEILQGPFSAHYVIEKPVAIDQLRDTVRQALDECGVGEVVRGIQSLERAEMLRTNEAERVFAERLSRQHELAKQLRQSADPANLSALARSFNVHRRTISRDLVDLINRGQLDPKAYPEYKSSTSTST